jgi:hypothetical protein
MSTFPAGPHRPGPYSCFTAALLPKATALLLLDCCFTAAFLPAACVSTTPRWTYIYIHTQTHIFNIHIYTYIYMIRGSCDGRDKDASFTAALLLLYCCFTAALLTAACVSTIRRWTIRGRAMGVTKTQAMYLSFSATGTQLTCFCWYKSTNADAAGVTDPRIHTLCMPRTRRKKIKKIKNTDAAGATDPRIYFVHGADTQLVCGQVHSLLGFTGTKVQMLTQLVCG